MTTEADVYFYIRGFCEPYEWPVIAYMPSRVGNEEDVPRRIEALAECVKPHGCVFVFPFQMDVEHLTKFYQDRKDIIVNPAGAVVNLDEWVEQRCPTTKITGIVCDNPSLYMDVVSASPETAKRCRFLFTPINSYSGGTRIRADMKQIALGWAEYKRWAFEHGNDQVLLYNEGA